MSKDMFTYDWNVVDYSANEEDWLEKPILKMTKSSVMSYEWCPKKYFYSYPLRLPQDRTDAMLKGTVIHDAYENFFHKFDVEKAEQLDKSELTSYAMGLFPIDEWGGDQYWTSAQFEAKRFLDCKDNGTLDDFLPVGNEVKLDALFMIARNQNPKFPLQRDYYVHLQGIIDRLFVDEGGLLPMELKTGSWKDYKTTGMRKESAFYKLLIEHCDDQLLIDAGIDPNMKVTKWGWWYPESNYIYVEPVKQTSTTSLLKLMAKVIWSYEQANFPAKYFYKTCSFCSFLGICDAAQEQSFW